MPGGNAFHPSNRHTTLDNRPHIIYSFASIILNPDFRYKIRKEKKMTEEQKNTGDGSGKHNRDKAFLGLILILVGVVFLLRNTNVLYIDNWWALFILIPAFAAFASAWRGYKASGRQVTREVRSKLVGGLFPMAVAIIFLLGLDFGDMWPLFIILAGVAVIFSG